LTNIYFTEPTKLDSKKQGEELYHHPSDGPVFGWGPDIACYSDFIKKDLCSTFPQKFQDVLQKGSSIFTGEINNNKYCKIKEIEVFKVIK
jgi:hypothetical protein